MDSTPGGQDELAVRLENGDEEALGELYALHRERLWRLVNFRMDKRLHARIDPDDVLQEAYIEAAKRIQHYPSDGSVSPFTWLRRVTHQTLVDVHRRHLGAEKRDAGREVAVEGPAFSLNTSASLVIQLIGRLTSPSQAALRAEMVQTVEDAIEGMDPMDREVLALRHFEELSNNEVAEVLGIQQKAASIRYVRAVRRLKELLSKLPGVIDELSHE